MTQACTTDFDDWLVETFARVGSFTMLIVLIDIGETTLSPLASASVDNYPGLPTGVFRPKLNCNRESFQAGAHGW